jgi:carbohydrate-binding DOMON domain-containing protein
MSTQYRLVQSGKTVSGGCSAGQGSSEPVAPRIYLFIITRVQLSFHALTLRRTSDNDRQLFDKASIMTN